MNRSVDLGIWKNERYFGQNTKWFIEYLNSKWGEDTDGNIVRKTEIP